MSLHDILQYANSALLVFVLTGMIRFHRDWSELRFMVRTLWREREVRIDERLDTALGTGPRAHHPRPIS